jgi:hypothetical protein
VVPVLTADRAAVIGLESRRLAQRAGMSTVDADRFAEAIVALLARQTADETGVIPHPPG